MKSQLGVTSSFLMKSSFSPNQIFNKKRNSYVSFFLVLCLAPFVADITFITLLLSQIYFSTTSYRLFHAHCRKWWHQLKGQHIFKIYVINVSKLIFKVTFCQVCFKWLPPTESIWPLKRATFAGSLVDKFKIKLNKA